MDAPSSGPETIAEFYARVEAALGPDRRLPVAVEEMPGWDIFPFEIDSLRIKPLAPLADSEPDRRGENEDECWCAGPFEPKSDDRLVWWNENWKLSTDLTGSGLPIMLWLSPMTHCDLPTMPPEVAAGIGPLMTTISAAIEDLPSVGRVQLAKYGDGGAHLHLLFMGRPSRMLQLRGSPMLDWEENLPRVPADVVRRNCRPIAEALTSTFGGQIGPAAG
ncbi:hypothetical protein [Yimella sp. NH-Cas1]|uniref:hypothetical protein n=1 Tax=Yimella sp. NH-Cas1 TaxID=2917726 RepID=UPI001EFBB20C|nr:hypothetical protein [Yimella sp. NH-Cas1]MCG8655880.1 hypothetical protein [Yimella sp. NH-Cas1]